jgi:ATP-dependent protease ClpP protease subunit
MSETYHKFKKDDIDQFMDNDIYIPTRTIYMGSSSYLEDDSESGTDHNMAESMVKALHILDSQASSGNKPITIIMNNIGGDEYHGMAIFDAIENCKNHVTIKIYGHAMSMGSVILQAADHRMMSRNSRIMIHYGTFGIHDHSKNSYKWTDEGKKFDAIMENIYMEKIEEKGKPISYEKYMRLIGRQEDLEGMHHKAKQKKIKIGKNELREMLNFDTFLDAEMALEMGFIDEIIE